jgi:RNA polymerase sigma-70 factor (ECF subfamily)
MATADVNGGMEARFMQGVLVTPPRVEVRAHRGQWVLLHWYAHEDGEAVRALTLLEIAGDAADERVSRLQNYFFNDHLITEVCRELGVRSKVNGYRWWLRCADQSAVKPRLST